MKRLALLTLLALPPLLVATLASAGGRKHNNLLRVITPRPKATVNAHPFVNIVIGFGESGNGAPADPTTFRARLGRQIIPVDMSCADPSTPACQSPADAPMNTFVPVVEGGQVVGLRARVDESLLKRGRGRNRLRLEVRSVERANRRGRARRKRDTDRLRFRSTPGENTPPAVTLRPIGVVIPELPVQLGADVTDPDLDAISYTWDIGQPTACADSTFDATSPEPTACFGANTTDITVRVTVSDGQATSQAERTVAVCPPLDAGRTPGTLKIDAADRLTFGPTPLGTTATRDLTLRNTDLTPTSQVRVRFGLEGEGFSLSAGDVALGPGESAPVTLSFTPTHDGHHSARLIAIACTENAGALQLLAHGVGGDLPGPTFARDPLFFTDTVEGVLGIGTFMLLPSGQRVFVDSTASLCEAPDNGPGSGDTCLVDRDCVNGGTCLKSSTCVRGVNDGQPCTSFTDCPGGFCPAQTDFDPLDMCSDGHGSLYLMSDEGTFTDLSTSGTELSGTIMRVDFDPLTGARQSAEILGRSTTQTVWMACDRLPASNRGSLYLAEYREVSLPLNCFRDEQEALVAVRKRNGTRSVLLPRIDAAAGEDNCQGDFQISEDLQVSDDGATVYATLDTGLYRLLPSPLFITPDYAELFQLHPDGSLIIARTVDQGLTGTLQIFKIFPEQAKQGALLLDELTPCATLSFLNNGGRSIVNQPYAVGRSATGGPNDGTILVSFLATGGVAGRGSPNAALPTALRLQGTAAFHSAAGSRTCEFLGYINTDLMELMTF